MRWMYSVGLSAALAACGVESTPTAGEVESALGGTISVTASAGAPSCSGPTAANVGLSGVVTASGAPRTTSITLAVDGGAATQVGVISPGSFTGSGPDRSATYSVTVSIPNGSRSLVVCATQSNGGSSRTGCAPAIPVTVQCLCTGVDCNDQNACTNDFCNPPTGLCSHIDLNRCATPSCGLGACAGPDTDGDGLSDAWEAQGYVDNNCNGVNDGPSVDLPLPNANPNVPNIYVEYDYMEMPGAGTTCATDSDCAAVAGEECVSGICTHTHAPKASGIQLVIDAFARKGIVLTVDSAHDKLTEHAVISYGQADSRTLDPTCVGPDAVNFFDVKDAHFDPRRRGIYHYAVFGHYAQCPNDPVACNTCGIDRGGGIPLAGQSGSAEVSGNDLIVSLGDRFFNIGVPNSLKAKQEGGTFMHELGHNFGLLHGGDEVWNYKPNYLSVMNFAYQFSGVLSGASGVPSSSRLDYSGETLAALDETSLDESQGAGGAVPNDLMSWSVNDTSHYASESGPVDWNADGVIQGSVAVDLNGDGNLRTLHGYNDWANLSLAFQCVPWGAD
jgi:hypothetical protein